MLNWPLKNRAAREAPEAAAQDPAASADLASRAAQQQAARSAGSRSPQAEEARASWLPRLHAAEGDDTALLQVAREAPLVDVKLAAVEALASEDALKQAERHFRSHDRRVHRAAKQRLEAKVAQRTARARAQVLIETAASMTAEALVPTNLLVALDRDWQALDAGMLEPAQNARFFELREQLNATLRERGERELQLHRWMTDANRALAELQRGCVEAATHGDPTGLPRLSAAAHALCVPPLDTPAAAALDAALQSALEGAQRVAARLEWLGALDVPAGATGALPASTLPDTGDAHAEAAQSHDGAPADLAPTPEGAAPADPPPAADPASHWRTLPPLADAALARLLDERFEAWQVAHRPASMAGAQVPSQNTAPPRHKEPSADQRRHLEDLLEQAEATLARGHLAGLEQQLQSLEVAYGSFNGLSPHDALRARHQSLQAEHARLKGWQQWGGGRARDDLLAEAEVLANLTTAATDTQARRAAKLNLKEHGAAIAALRKRWRDLDHLGAGASQAMWQRFDVALTTAHQPVAAQQAASKAARRENLAAREALLLALEAVPDVPTDASADAIAAHWKESLHALDHFHRAWRQLGPLEHTVPNAARAGLLERLRRSVGRIEAPLHEARSTAEAAREQLIVRAEALAQQLAAQPQLRDAFPRLRELQAEWQQHARAVPLARGAENVLWARFKAATDAVFRQRDAALHAHDAELAANLAAREALLARLTGLRADTPVAQIERTLTEVDRAWRQPVDLPRGAAAALDARLQDVHGAALRALAASAAGQWHAVCDALAGKLALCEERESGPAGNPEQTERWAALTGLPTTWERALAQRWSAPVAPGALSDAALNDLLLQLEIALDLPATPEQLVARRALKLRAMKDTLEGRGSSHLDPARRAEGFAAVLRQSGLDAAQRDRLRAIVAALRQAPAGTLVPPAARGG